MLAARVIGTSADTASQTIYLDRGERMGFAATWASSPGWRGGQGDRIVSRHCAGAATHGPGERRGRDAFRIRAFKVRWGGTGEPLLSMKYIPPMTP